MYFSKVLSILSLAAAATAQTVSYDTGYDDASRSLDDVACSDGANGLITRYGWQTQGQVTGFPFIGGAQAVTGWNSPSCGTCWSATYNGNTIYVLAVDVALEGLNISEEAMNALTDGNAVQYGRVDATITQVDISYCGL